MDGIEETNFMDMFTQRPLSEEEKIRIRTETDQAIRYKCACLIADIFEVHDLDPYAANYIIKQAEVLRKYIMGED